MSTVTMSVHEGLAKLKLYDQKLNKMLSTVPPMAATIRNKDTTIGGVSKEQFKEKADSFLKSFNALMENRAVLKSAIVNSNANTKVTIANKEYTVADAIERKNTMETLKKMNSVLILGYTTENTRYNNLCDRFQTDFERFMTNLGGDAGKRKPEEVEVFRKTFEETNGCNFHNPLNLMEIINSNEATLDSFFTEVDFRLSESNALTKITVEFVD